MPNMTDYEAEREAFFARADLPVDGREATRLLTSRLGDAYDRLLSGFSSNAHVTVTDDAPSAPTEAAADRIGVSLVDAPDDTALDAMVADAELVVPSPGLPDQHQWDIGQLRSLESPEQCRQVLVRLQRPQRQHKAPVGQVQPLQYLFVRGGAQDMVRPVMHHERLVERRKAQLRECLARML